jgi:hypothetical protein
MQRMGNLIGVAFFAGVVVGFTVDLFQFDAPSLGRGSFGPLFGQTKQINVS